MIDILRASLPPDLANFTSFQEVLEYDVENSRAECKRVLDQLTSTRKLLYNVKVLQSLRSEGRAHVNVGNSTFIPSRMKGDSILVSLGYQFYLEMTLQEAETYYNERIKLIWA
ncbi:hypothetical protein BEWA_004980 [Theileria equi strain WA]|uniref:Uncharacterized protein n=1 Tax=Theileria equi strain WA TaxID=1537102 RepID=L0AZU4_THEEQ|nr:hypothetical protein BEWA_004980 [Theileria equi strain WA]AFZ81090.1 hypothetical protein BEWA_004980 [Theileria equi strain WA]|eukprot:XP_004830756.1 hypothetical protein BEWA_004980 [Theileria equi strain WA]